MEEDEEAEKKLEYISNNNYSFIYMPPCPSPPPTVFSEEVHRSVAERSPHFRSAPDPVADLLSG